MQKTPSVYLMIESGNGFSAIARAKKSDGKFEVVETTDSIESPGSGPLAPGATPDWSTATICDGRGSAGQAGFALLDVALRAAEANAREVSGHQLEHVTL